MQVLICDKCGEERTDTTLMIAYEESRDADGRLSDDCTRVDICGKCAIKVLWDLTHNTRHTAKTINTRFDLNRVIIESIGGNKFPT